jgi:hypothetical protein
MSSKRTVSVLLVLTSMIISLFSIKSVMGYSAGCPTNHVCDSDFAPCSGIGHSYPICGDYQQNEFAAWRCSRKGSYSNCIKGATYRCAELYHCIGVPDYPFASTGHCTTTTNLDTNQTPTMAIAVTCS